MILFFFAIEKNVITPENLPFYLIRSGPSRDPSSPCEHTKSNLHEGPFVTYRGKARAAVKKVRFKFAHRSKKKSDFDSRPLVLFLFLSEIRHKSQEFRDSISPKIL